MSTPPRLFRRPRPFQRLFQCSDSLHNLRCQPPTLKSAIHPLTLKKQKRQLTGFGSIVRLEIVPLIPAVLTHTVYDDPERRAIFVALLRGDDGLDVV